MADEKYKVLIVEDQDEIRQLFATWFEAAGYIVVRAANGEEGMRVFKAERPDVVITDQIMPVMGGLEFCRRVREELEVPIMVLSALPEEDARTDSLEAGACAFAVKPTTMGDLMEWVRAFLPGTEGRARLSADVRSGRTGPRDGVTG